LSTSFPDESGQFLIVADLETERLDSVDLLFVKEKFKKYGTILFRGFQETVESYENFTTKFSNEFLFNGHPALTQLGKDGCTVAAPPKSYSKAVPLHKELDYAPGANPDLIWFFCTVPPVSDGETIICDGIKLLQNLPKELSQNFASKGVCFKYVWEEGRWSQVFSTKIPYVETKKKTTRESVNVMLKKFPDCSFHFDREDRLHISYVTQTIQPTRWQSEEAWISAIFAHHPGFTGRKTDAVTYGDGTEISQYILDEIHNLAIKLSITISWEKFDILMLDNTRFMHGRNKFKTGNRVILVRRAISQDYGSEHHFGTGSGTRSGAITAKKIAGYPGLPVCIQCCLPG